MVTLFWGTQPGKRTKNDGESLFLMGKSTIFMAMFNGYVSLPEGIPNDMHPNGSKWIQFGSLD